MSEPVFRLDHAAAGYGPNLVFKDLDLSITTGCVTALCGPNGCGKSTILKSMRGALRLRAGQAMISGRSVGTLSARTLAREVAMLGQSPSASEDMSVREVVTLGRYAHRPTLGGLAQADITAITRALQRTDLHDLADRPIATLSGGQVQRTWLAMIIAQDAPVLFLDEPTNHLDLSHALETLTLVRELTHTEGRTVVIVLHDLNMAATFADRIVLFDRGVKRAEGSVQDVLRADIIADVFGVQCDILRRPDADLPLIVPRIVQQAR